MILERLLYIIIFLTSLTVAKWLQLYALKYSLIDHPNERSSHAVPTPRGGGLSIVIAFLAGLTVLAFWGHVSARSYLAFAGGGAIAAAVGFWDDHRDLPARRRLLFHFIAALWALYWLMKFPSQAGGVILSELLLNVFWVVALVWLLNSYNFMDGIDGIAGAEALFISGGAGVLFFLNGDHALLSVSILVFMSTAGFLFWNLPPAKIFMGDVGSGFLGIVLGILALAAVRSNSIPVWVWLILFGSFIVDSTVTIFRRILRTKDWYKAHRSHAYQHAASILQSHGKVTLAVTSINVLWLFPWACAAWSWQEYGPLFSAVALVPLVCLTFHFKAGVERCNYIEVENGR